MLELLAKLIFAIAGWKVDPRSPTRIRRAVMTAAPHTSNWDIVYARAAFVLLGLPVRFTIKKEWMRFPFGLILRPLGAIPIDREYRNGKKLSMVQAMTELFDHYDEIIILITPEGTRQYAPEWKSGFYHIAKEANVPILMGYLDYDKKVAGVSTIVVSPSGDLEADTAIMKDFYRTVQGRYPERGIQ